MVMALNAHKFDFEVFQGALDHNHEERGTTTSAIIYSPYPRPIVPSG